MPWSRALRPWARNETRPSAAAGGADRPARGRAEPRIVSAGGTATEIVYALGAQKGLIGTDTTSLFPPEAQSLTSIGYVRNLSAEGVVSLNPTLVIAAAEAGPPPILAQIKTAGIPVLALADGFTEEAVLTRIGQIGDALGKTPEAAKLQDAVRRDLTAVRAALAPIKRPPESAVRAQRCARPRGRGRE
ncbi:heme/hemin ABC transporter substrate-binding protein [Elstera litoralis]|uniref:heme/hemin ABC transporter substrate-binding protein n=1 Tax=Elstera litoralis TaxID=552518 RepID=UPI0006984100|nr:ABC transporter substrate-binding protein [Elstera litoralis]